MGRPVKTWRRSTKEEMKMANINWNTAERMAPNRVHRRCIVDALCLKESLKDKVSKSVRLLRAVFSALFLLFGNVVEYSLSCLAYYLNLH